MPRYSYGITRKTTKRYPRITAGPLRNQYIHRVVAAAILHRDLKKDEQVHHKDANRLNFHWANLLILGERDHGWVSAKQAWFMKNLDEKQKKEWDEFMDQEEKQQKADIELAQSFDQPYAVSDGHMAERWENRSAM